ncbi:MAG TPA: DNA-processing protein DprA, partial [Patescibacteria group bacterium]|nr:DNA-processing protein DprA [Patescibacteria group bacterium]
MREGQEYLLGLSLIPDLGNVRIKLLLEHLGSPRLIWQMSEREVRALKLPSSVQNSFLENRKKIDLAREFDDVITNGVTLLTLSDDNYPPLLKEIYDPPAVLYIKGKLNPTSLKIGVVGTRLMTAYGHQLTQSLTQSLVASGLTIVSGLARGVDSLAHRSTLQSGGVTVAVLGSGLNRIYPAENKHLAEEITQKGAVISEYALNCEATRGTFPARNRIISGLCLGVLVTEAGEDSGSLITANAALEQGRHVFSVPGPINSRQSVGTNSLLKIGAKLVTGADDILEELNLEGVSAREMTPITGDTPDEVSVLNILSLEPFHIDDLARATKIPAGKLGGVLTVMVISGKVSDLGGG